MATLELTSAPGGENRLLSLRVTPEQEIAIYAFFQINGWTIITEGRNWFNFQDIITLIIINNIFSLKYIDNNLSKKLCSLFFFLHVSW